MAALVLAAIVTAIALVFILLPLVRPGAPAEADRPESPTERLRREKESVYLAIREVEFDHRTGKVSDEDHAVLMARYRARAIELLKQIDALPPDPAGDTARKEDRRAPGEAIEREIRAALSADPRTAAPLPRCAGCGKEILPVHRFCTRCGLPVPEPPAAASAGKERA